MAQKVLYEIEVDAKFEDLKKLQTEMDGLRNRQNELSKTNQKGTSEFQANKIAMKELQAQYRATSKQSEVNRKGAIDLGNSYNALTEQNRKLSIQLRQIQDPLGKDKKLFDQIAGSINNNTDKLKQMDNAMGRQQRNVGNYGSACLLYTSDAADE